MGQVGPSRVSGTYNGTAATLYICVGFIPDWVRLWNLENAEDYWVYWSKNFRANERVNGVLWSGDDDANMDVTPAAGGTALVAPYSGGVMLTSSEQTSVTFGSTSADYLVFDGWDGTTTDYRSTGTLLGLTIDTWELDTSASRTGSWNDGCSTTYVGEGSRILIDGVWYTICALTNDGDTDDDVTLNADAPSGTIEFLGGMYSMAPLAVGKITPPGFVVGNTTFNASGEMQMFECGCYDN